MREPSLTCNANGFSAWRLTYPRYNKPDVIIRAESDGRIRRPYVIEYRESEGQLAVQIVSATERRLTADEWKEIELSAVEGDFWNRPNELEPDLCDESGETCRVILHQPVFLFEGRGHTYHVVRVWFHSGLSRLEEILQRLAKID